MEAPIKLAPFCYKGDDRPDIAQPFSKWSRTYATNAHICVRVPLRADAPRRNRPNAHRLFPSPPPITTPVKFIKGLPNGPVNLRGAVFDGKYLRLLARLPNLRAVPRARNRDAMYFSFDGGDGLLMPMNATSSIDAELPK